MQQETITVQYVNPPKPGKKMGSVKDSTGRYFNVWPDKLAMFQPNQTYSVLYETGQWNGKETYTIKSINSSEAPTAPAQSPQPSAAPARPASMPMRETSQRDAERMFVCSLMNAAIQSGQLNTGGPDLVPTINALRTAWHATFGADNHDGF